MIDRPNRPRLRPLALMLLAAFAWASGRANAADPWLTFPGGPGPGSGKKVVLISGDEEYRSEQALPELAAILSRRHGFDCVVLLPIGPDGSVMPTRQDNIPGLEALAGADLMIIATRFRDLPDDQMKFIADYLDAGKPVIGMRTATHAFSIKPGKAFGRFSWNSKVPGWEGGFGRRVLGETWIDHHGKHGSQSTRGIITPAAEGHPIVRGIRSGDIWGPTDVYAVRLPLPGDSLPLVLGEVVADMTPEGKPVEGAKNDPMMPVAWVKTYPSAGDRPAKAFATTMGAATDLQSAGVRRLLVNASYWATGLEGQIRPDLDVELVGDYKPLRFGFGGEAKGLKPEEFIPR